MRQFVTSLLVLTLTSTIATAEDVPVTHGSAAMGMPAAELPGAPIPLRRVAPRPTREALTAILTEQRTVLLHAFRAYRLGKDYPMNLTSRKVAHVWVDQDGRACAVANMVRESGSNDLFMSVAESNNALRVADVKTGELQDWILTSGFTREELVMIQVPFVEVMPSPEQEQRFAKAPPQETKPAFDENKRAREVARLAKMYASIEKKLRANSKTSIQTAVDRLLADRDLAQSVVFRNQ